MILKSPLPFEWHTSTFEEIQKVDTAPEMPAVNMNTRNKVVLREDDWQPQPSPQEWTPPPYWKNLLHMDESRFEQECKKWFFRTLTIAMILYVLTIASIFLGKLLMIVIELK